MSEIEYRAAQVVDVAFPRREVTLVVMPFEEETRIWEQGRSFIEICSRGAYDGIERRSTRVRVNRDHDPRLTCGRATAFRSKAEGLIADVYLSKTATGDEALQLAADDCLGASAGFTLLRDENGKVYPDAEVWETGTRRRLNRLYLSHIGMVSEPAYAGAVVQGVRQKGSQGPTEAFTASRGTPNLDQLELRRLEEAYAAIDSRYRVA